MEKGGRMEVKGSDVFKREYPLRFPVARFQILPRIQSFHTEK
jgi:hypothetical protein